MFFVKYFSLTDGEAARSEVKPPRAKARLIENIRDNCLFAAGAGTLVLIVRCGLC
jgi:hypothetical protein